MQETENVCGDFYVICRGETLCHIAKKNGIMLTELLEMNPYLNPSYYLVGQTILVPKGIKKNP